MAGNLVTLSWTPPTEGATPLAYVIVAGSAPGLSNVAVLDLGAPMTSVSGAGGRRHLLRAHGRARQLRRRPALERGAARGGRAVAQLAPTRRPARLVRARRREHALQVLGDVLVGGEPHAGLALHVLDQAVEHRHA